MRARTSVLTMCLIATLLPASGADRADAPEVFFREDFDTGADGWWGDPYWRLSPERTHSGTNALHFGDDESGVMFCEELICRLEVRSPVFHVPAGSPAHLYFWAYIDAFVASDVLTVDVETLDADDEVLHRERVFSTALGQDWVFHADLTAFTGNDARLVFMASLGFVHEWEQGIFVDDVVVTDRYVETESVLVVTGDGPTARARLDVLPEDRKIVESRIEGTGNVTDLAFAAYRQREGDPPTGWAQAAGWGVGLAAGGTVTDPQAAYHIKADVVVTGAGTPILDEDLSQTTLTGLPWSLVQRFQTNGFEPGSWDNMLTVYGANGTTATVVVRSQSPGAAALAVGGETIGFGHAADLEADLFVGSRHGPWSLVGGRGSWSADGPSLGSFFPAAQLGATPSQSSPNGPFSGGLEYADQPGQWSYRLDHAANPEHYAFSLFHINTVPERPAAQALPVPDLTSIPWGPRTGDVRYPEYGERPWSLQGSIGCQANVLGIGTDPSCGLFPVVWSTAHFPIVSNGGLVRIDYRLASDLPVLGTPTGTTIGDTCLTIETEAFQSQGCQTAGERETLIQGDPLLADAARLDVALAKDETGAAYIERSAFDVYFRYDLSLVPPLGG